MRNLTGIEGITAALAVIIVGVLAFFFVMRRRPTPESLGFSALTEPLPSAETISERLFAEPPHSLFHKSAADRDVYLMFVDAGSVETPACVVGFADIGTSRDSRDIAVLHSERQIPKILRRLQGGMFKWAQPVDQVANSLRPGTGWFWYAAEQRSVEDTPLARAFAHTSHNHGSRQLLGLAWLGSHVVVWASHPHAKAVVSCLERLVCDHGGPSQAHGLR